MYLILHQAQMIFNFVVIHMLFSIFTLKFSGLFIMITGMYLQFLYFAGTTFTIEEWMKLSFQQVNQNHGDVLSQL